MILFWSRRTIAKTDSRARPPTVGHGPDSRAVFYTCNDESQRSAKSAMSNDSFYNWMFRYVQGFYVNDAFLREKLLALDCRSNLA